jgi:poly(3-hydroxybutyrate) depolymerase
MKILGSTMCAAIILAGSFNPAFGYETFTVDFKGKEQVVHYDLYVPPVEPGERVPVLVCVGGLPIVEGQYVHSDPTECTGEAWKAFADSNGIAILGVGFLFDQKQWERKKSYQFPKAWSGKALQAILTKLAENKNIDPDNLYLFGISAGAQFAVRYAFYQPQSVKAVAAHAAGGYDKPSRKIDSRFLITVGSQDNEDISRVDWANFFVKRAQKLGIAVKPVLLYGIGHQQTEMQNEMSRDFFRQVLTGKI